MSISRHRDWDTLGVLFEEVLSWVRTLPGSQRLRALLVFDEVYRFLPPHPANPPTKRPLVALMKQARAFGARHRALGPSEAESALGTDGGCDRRRAGVVIRWHS